ncbi:unnamed protein product [Vicia faba]|uniref:NAD(P)-binding domain-containing protein n=1 Tax=Vicia faba TaxID=3906 RepID=A0AAV0Z8K6_VICFA|nr:unnamed protein product [Vicia faba]
MQVDNFGTVNLVEACRKVNVNRFILISSILVNGAAMGQLLNPAYIFLNVFGLTLVAKLQAENHIRKSGINYTIIRPGGLKNDPPTGNVVMEPEDTLYEGSISRDQVAEVAVESLAYPESSYKVVEIVARPEAPKRAYYDLFEISSGFARLGNLQYLDLSSNSLEGTIPRQFGSLLHLQYLDLSYNALDGTIPRHLGNLSRLQYLDLSYNGLDGTIPHQLGSLSNLQELHLQYNQGLKVDDENNHVGGTQLQSFVASSYEGNADLCGKPLDKKCPGDEEAAHEKLETVEESSPEDKKSIYLSVGLGFITGFWALWGSLFLIRTWRHKYVLFLNNIVDRITSLWR